MNVVTRTVNCLSLCSGIGGLELGLSLVAPGLRVVCHVEREASAAALLVARMEDKSLDDAPIWDDLSTFDGAAWRGTVDIVVAGFPCQPWSVAGQRKGTEDERWIWGDIIRIIREVRPGLVFLENVPGLLVHAGLGSVLGDLAETGFDAEWGCFTAAEVGASHQRERVFILGYAESGKQWIQRQCQGEPQVTIGRSGSDVGYASSVGRGFSGNTNGQHDIQGNEVRDIEEDKQFGSGRLDRVEQISGNVADSDRQRLQGRSEQRHGGTECVTTSKYIFPPYPNDLEGWSRVLAEMPSLEPAVCRVADEFPNRVDRLRALGNAVVPLEAAYAFATFATRSVD